MELLAHVIVLGLAAFVLTVSWYPAGSYFSWHPTLMTVGYLVFMCEAVLLFHPKFSPILNHALRVKLHVAMQVSGLVAAVAGGLHIYWLKDSAGKEHVTTWHAFFGVLSLLLTSWVVLGGPLLLYPKVRKALRITSSLGDLKRKHAQMAVLTLCCALLTIGLAFHSNWFMSKGYGKWTHNVTFGVICTIVGLIVGQVMQNRFS